MIHNLFSLPVYHYNLANDIDLSNIRENIEREFQISSSEISPLEKQGGISTYSTNCNLHLEPYLQNLNSIILQHIKIYWKILDVDQRLSPVIDQCWSNIHYQNSYTDQHSHSLMPVVATFYLEAAPNCGDLILINPMEYSLTHIPYSVPIERKTETALQVKTGDLILFPGWVRHKTGENLSGSSRVVISYNIRYSGNYLSSDVEYPTLKQNFSNSEVSMLYNKIANLEYVIENMKRTIQNGG